MIQINENGIENLAIGIVDQARKDYIKGAFKLIKKFRKPVEECLKDPYCQKYIGQANMSNSLRDIFWMMDARRFMKKDPYGLLRSEKDYDSAIKSWNETAWKMYKDGKQYISWRKLDNEFLQ